MTNSISYVDGGKTSEQGWYDIYSRLFTSGVANIINPTAWKVTQRAAGANMSVDIAVGGGLIGLSTSIYNSWGFSDAINNKAITAADSSNPRRSIAVAYRDLAIIDSTSSNNPGALKFAVIDGTAAGSPTDPSDSVISAAVGSGNPWIKLARITLPAGASSVVDVYITDLRRPIGWMGNVWGGTNNTNGHTVPNVADDTVALLNAAQTLANKTFSNPTFTNYTGWQQINATLTYAGNNGQKEFLINTSADLSGVASVGSKLKLTRGTTPPTQCMSFTAASSQYATQSSPTGISFTSAFTCEAWIYVNSYPATGNDGTIISRKATGGFGLAIEPNGQLRGYYQDGSANYTSFDSYQAIPLKRWVHVAVAVSSVFSKTGIIYINGISVPGYSALSTATSMVQAGPLQVGAVNSTFFFDGYVSEARIWSVAQSQASIQANMAVNLTGSETNLVALFKGNGNFNDTTANANNLTATNGVIATQAANPYNATEYGIITKFTSSQLTVFCGTDYMIPNMTLSNPYFSRERVPYGFPASRGKWIVDTYALARQSVVTTTVAWYYSNLALSVPTGEWRAGYNTNALATHAGVGFLGGLYELSTANNASTNIDLRCAMGGSNVTMTQASGSVSADKPISLLAQTPYYFIAQPYNTNETLYFGDNSQPVRIYAECAYV